MPKVAVEFYGLARLRAGAAGTDATADTVAGVLAAVAHTFPTLSDVAGKHFLVSVNGERFVTDFNETLPAGTRLLLLSADAGG